MIMYLKKNPNLKESSIVPGRGYSTDSQSMAPNICFNATISSIVNQSGLISLSTSTNFFDFQEKINIDVTTKGKIGMFSESSEYSYMRSIEDKFYSLSLNYFQYFSNKVSVGLNDIGLDALNHLGKQFYGDGNDPLFGLQCGDRFISSYDQGAMLLMSININFANAYDKQTFIKKAGVSFGNIFSASESIQNIATTNGIEGTVNIQAYQKGGDPSKLSEILSKDASGNYYILSCSITNMDDCKKAANGLLNYAEAIFPKQFELANNTGITPLGDEYTDKERLVMINLNATSTLTPTILVDRILLAEQYINNQHHLSLLNPIQNNYPVKLAPEFAQKINYLYG